MRSPTPFLLIAGCFGLVGATIHSGDHLRGSKHHEDGELHNGQKERKLANIMMPGARVSAIDRDGAICSANQMPNQQDVPMNATVITYYYAIESSTELITENIQGRATIRALEDQLFRAIRPAILWCYFDEEEDSRRSLLKNDVSLSQQEDSALVANGETLRQLSLEEARRLSIVSFSNSPEDEELSAFECNFETSDTYCIVMEGRVTIMHHVTSDVSLAIASVYDSTEKAMDFSDIFFSIGKDDSLGNITNIKWLGENEEAILPIIDDGAVEVGEPIPIIVDENESEENEQNFLAYAVSIPILLALAALLFLGKKKVKRKVVTAGEFAWPMYDDVLIGTGDHPDSFHEGMYHYSQYGVRYLSTNCKTCIETKMNGFFTEDDLETISEHSVETDGDLSAYRKRHLVDPNVNNLGAKHSAIDVHQCSSARCHICAYKPRNVEFANCTPCADVEFISKIPEEQEMIEEPLRSGEGEV